MATSTPSDADAATLERLNCEYPNWRVWRSLDDHGRTAAWVASNKTPDSLFAPTLHEPTAERLEFQLKAPPRAFGGSLTKL